MKNTSARRSDRRRRSHLGASLRRHRTIDGRGGGESGQGDLGRCVRRDVRTRQGGQEGGHAQRDHPPGRLGQLRQHHQGLLEEVRHQDQLGKPRRHQARTRSTRSPPRRASPVRPTSSTWARPSPSRRPRTGLLAPYKVASWSEIPSTAKACQRGLVRRLRRVRGHRLQLQGGQGPPDLVQRSPQARVQEQVALNGNPTQAGAAFAAVYAAALANGGSFSNIAPGIAYFQKLSQAGNFVPVTGERVHGRERADADPDLVGLPRRVRGGPASSRAGRSSSRATATTPPTTARPSAPRRRTRRRPGSGRSTCTRPPARTCGCRARPGRSSWPPW